MTPTPERPDDRMDCVGQYAFERRSSPGNRIQSATSSSGIGAADADSLHVAARAPKRPSSWMSDNVRRLGPQLHR